MKFTPMILKQYTTRNLKNNPIINSVRQTKEHVRYIYSLYFQYSSDLYIDILEKNVFIDEYCG